MTTTSSTYKKSSEVSIKARSTPASVSFKGQVSKHTTVIKQLLDEVEHDIMNYQNRGLYYLLKPKAEADNTDTRF